MNKINDGGPAFPDCRWDNEMAQEYYHNGMSLRDYFAGQAMIGIIFSQNPICDLYGEAWQKAHAKLSYELADAMIKAREVSDE